MCRQRDVWQKYSYFLNFYLLLDQIRSDQWILNSQSTKVTIGMKFFCACDFCWQIGLLFYCDCNREHMLPMKETTLPNNAVDRVKQRRDNHSEQKKA